MPVITKQRMLAILSRSSGADRISRICDRFLSTMILLNLLAVSLESIDALSAAYGHLFFAFEMFSVAIFGFEYLLRIWSVAANEASRYTSATGRRLEYIFSFTGLIDLIAITKPAAADPWRSRSALASGAASCPAAEDLALLDSA